MHIQRLLAGRQTVERIVYRMKVSQNLNADLRSIFRGKYMYVVVVIQMSGADETCVVYIFKIN